MTTRNLFLIPQNAEGTYYQGYIKAKGAEYYFEIEFEKPFTKVSVKCEWELQQILKPCMDEVKQVLKNSSNVQEFANDLQKLVKKHTTNSETGTSLKYISVLVTQIEELGWDKVKDVSHDFSTITLFAVDAADREHILTANPKDNYPTERPHVKTELPVHFVPQWGGVFSNLKELHRQFIELLPMLQRFWDDLDELCNKCWIVEPEKQSLSAHDYRIALSKTSSVLLKIDPMNPGNPPECRFMGAESSIAPLKEIFFNNLEDWNETLSIYQNLKGILKIDFPRKSENPTSEAALQCGICYSYKLETHIPDQACNERRCGQLFHRACLVEWIQSVPGAKQSFKTLFGECPYCNSAITVKL